MWKEETFLDSKVMNMLSLRFKKKQILDKFFFF